MRVAITTVQVPFVKGGAEFLANDLKTALIEHGHEAEIISIPFKWYPAQKIIDHTMATRLLDLTSANGQDIDLLIGLKYPAYIIEHPNKVLWILHQHRTAYELWNTKFGDIIHHPNGRQIKEFIIQSDNKFIPEAKQIYTISQNVSNRLRQYNNIDSLPLYPPPPNREVFYTDIGEDYIFFPSRVTTIKRQDLAIEAFKFTKTNVKLVIAGKADHFEFQNNLLHQCEILNIRHKIIFLGEISEEEKLKYYSKALAVIYPPLNEDYGYITLESLLSEKPVITCLDSGGPLEFIKHNINGFVVEADPEAIAEKIDELYLNRDRTKKMGQEGKRIIEEMNITWNRVVEVLTK